jgi:nitric oxide synthase-interacting protein
MASGNLKQRIGSESQLAFGYCALSLNPAENPVVSPSGRIYSREFILEYLLTKGKDLKKQWKEYEDQQAEFARNEENKVQREQSDSITKFVETHDGVKSTLKRKAGDSNSVVTYGQAPSRAKFIDDTGKEEKMVMLSHSSPWMPQFIPHARDATLVEPPKRPPSPFSGRPLRSKDLIPIDLIKEAGSTAGSVVKYLCPVSR